MMPLNLLDLPVELQFQIIEQLDDVFEYMRLARVCKKLQSLVRTIVLLVSDASTPSQLFNSVANTHLQILLSDHNDSQAQYKPIFQKYQYFVLEYSCTKQTNVLADYICLIAELKSKKSQKIDIVYLNELAAKSSKRLLFDARSSITDKISQVSKAIFANGSDLALIENHEGQVHEHGHDLDALVLMGHTHYFDSLKTAPQIYVYAHKRCDFKIIAPSLNTVSGITNVNDQLPRLPTLISFLKYSTMPNLRVLTGVGIESGMDLRVFERFENLNTLHLDSVFTGNLTLNVEQTRLVTLPNLQVFKISGNSISISDLYLPKLKTFDFTISGSTERNFGSTLHMENIQTPNLEELFIMSSSVPDAPKYILEQLTTDSILKMSIFSSNLSTFPKFAELHFPSLESLKLGVFNVSSDETGFEPVSFKINAPNLKHLNVKNLQSYNQVLFNENISYNGLETLQLHLKVLPDPQSYNFTKEKYPDLENLEIGYFNKFGRLVSNNIDLYLDLPQLKKLITKQEVLDKLESTMNLKDGNIDLKMITSGIQI